MKKYESLHERLRGPIVEALKKELKVTNVHALPRITKVTVNVGINRAKMESKEMHEYIGQCLGKMTGQKAVFTRSRKAISNFKIRQGLIVGAVVTLMGLLALPAMLKARYDERFATGVICAGGAQLCGL